MSRIDALLTGLQTSEKIGRLHHAYLLTGAEVSSKLTFAHRWMELYAHEKNQESALDKIIRGMVPDFYEIKPIDDSISVEAIRELPRVCSYAPLEFLRRLILIHDAHSMNVQASNALLKILEEPPTHTIFLLLCQERSQVLQTITSRCQEIRFFPQSKQQLTETIASSSGTVPDSFLISLCEGSTQRWSMFQATEGAIDAIQQAREMLFQLWEHSPRVPSPALNWLEQQEHAPLIGIIVDAWQSEVRNFSSYLMGAVPEGMNEADLLRYKKIQSRMNEKNILEIAAKGTVFSRYRIHRDRNSNLKLNLLNLFCLLQFSQK